MEALFEGHGPDLGEIQDAASKLHVQILESMKIQNPTLGKAYSLGTTLADTALAPAPADGDAFKADLHERLRMHDTRQVYTWLSELKSLLPDHTAYAVTYTLKDWQDWAAGSLTPPKRRNGADPGNEAHKLQHQARIWRQLLTGEKKATDLLNIGHYLDAAREVLRRVGVSALRYWKVFVPALVLLAGAVYLLSLFHDVNATTKYVANLIWLAGILGLSVKGVGSLLGNSLKDVEGWLWQAELDESVVEAAARLPGQMKHKRRTGTSVGSLVPVSADSAGSIASAPSLEGRTPPA